MEAKMLRRHYAQRQGWLGKRGVVRAVDGVSFSVAAGKTLAVVGESGSGKSTLARMAALIEPPSTGDLLIDGKPAMVGSAHLSVQMVFQNPYGSLNPRKTVGSALGEPLAINGRGDGGERRQRALEMMRKVGLREDQYGRYPHMFSGGQRQRIAIARALMLRPRVVVADEPVSALDVSIQAQVLNLMMDLQDEFSLAYLFISHDLSVVRHIANEVMVLYFGRPVEQGPKDAIFAAPRHPYTRMLLAATPSVDPRGRRRNVVIQGELPSPLAPPPGCAFASRCPFADSLCVAERPELRALDGQLVACHYAETV
jgi:dipeptide transport system ATP-binding protein